jgi:hypothetical protein
MSTPAVAVEPAFARLNDVAWRGVAGRYRNVVSRCTEAPDVFHLGSFLAAVGCLVGRRVWVCSPHRTYPNFYCLLVGKTANARKTTAYQFAVDLFDEAQELLYDDHAKRLNGLASPEGLALAMKYRDSPEPYRILGIEDEFRSLITKGGQKAVANLIPKLTELFNSPRTFEVNTKSNPIRVPNPFLCLLAASTRAWFEQSMTNRDVSGGFLNRWLLFEGASERLLPSPPPVEQRPWDNVVLEVADAINSARGFFQFSPDADAFYNEFYAVARRDFDSEATSRTDLHARKVGLLYAVLANRKDNLIHLDDIEAGAEVAKYCARVAEPIAQCLEVSQQRGLEDRLKSLLHAKPGLEKRDLYRSLHISAIEFERMLQPLEKYKVIRVQDEKYYVN